MINMLSDTVRKVLRIDTSEICCEEARRKVINHLNVRAQKPDGEVRIDLEIEKIIDRVSKMGCEELWDFLNESFEEYGLAVSMPNMDYILMNDEQIEEIMNDWVKCGSLDIRTATEEDYDSRV